MSRASKRSAIAGSAALAVFSAMLCSGVLAPATDGSLRLVSRVAVATPIADSPWGASWDALAQPPASFQADALAALVEAAGWLGAGALLIAVFSLVLHTIGRILEEWHALSVRCALGAQFRDLLRFVGRDVTGQAGRGAVLGAGAGGIALAALSAWWPALLTRPPSLLPAILAAVLAAMVVALALFLTAAPILVVLQRRVRAVSDLHGDHVTARGPLLFAQSSLAVLQLAGLLVVAYGGALIVRGSSLFDPDRPVPYADTSTITPLTLTDSTAPARAARLRRMANDAQRGDTPLVAIAGPGAWQGFGKRMFASKACLCFEAGVFKTYKSTAVRVVAVTPGALGLMGTRIVSGRGIMAADTLDGMRVAVVSEAVAARIRGPGREVLGAAIELTPDPRGSYRVVGIAESPAIPGLGSGAAAPMMWVSLLQHPAATVELTMRDGARRRLTADGWHARHLGGVVTGEPRALAELIRAAEAPIAWFGALVLCLTLGALAVAVYALVMVMGQSVTLRRRDIATRMALGAQSWDIVRWVGVRSLVLTTVGAAIGLSGAAQIGLALRKHVKVAGAADIQVLLLMLVAFCGLAVLAALLPARRALKVEPAAAWSERAR